MKNYDEMANDVFRRISEYEVAQKQKRKTVGKTVTSLCCICLVAAVGICVWQSGLFKLHRPSL